MDMELSGKYVQIYVVFILLIYCLTKLHGMEEERLQRYMVKCIILSSWIEPSC